MMRIAVIGAGVLGASAAFHLTWAGAEVVLVDQAHLGRATAAGAGIICPWASERFDADWYRIAVAGARYYPKLVALLAEAGRKTSATASRAHCKWLIMPRNLIDSSASCACAKTRHPKWAPSTVYRPWRRAGYSLRCIPILAPSTLRAERGLTAGCSSPPYPTRRAAGGPRCWKVRPGC